MLRRFILAFAAILATGLIAGPAFAGGAVNKTFFGTALKGYDAVAYHTLDRPVEGSRQFTYTWRGATWRFISAKHRDLFAADKSPCAPFTIPLGYRNHLQSAIHFAVPHSHFSG